MSILLFLVGILEKEMKSKKYGQIKGSYTAA